MPRRVVATYRLQMRKEFPLSAATALVPYFAKLGVSHLYFSPILAARPGSGHGYDVIDHARLNPELGTEDDLRELATRLHERGMGIILDVVPNHMSATSDNRYWDDVLERGQGSRYAEWFDIDWDSPDARGRVILPVLGTSLGDAIARDEIRLHIRDSGSRIAYFDKTFPLDPATLPREVQLAQLDPAARPAAEEWASGADGRKRLRSLLGEQHYRLMFWRHSDRINYRRFFEVNDLVALRMETDAVFEATHGLVLRWVKEGLIDGLRIDHVDGLRSPAWYLARLRAAVDEARHPDTPNPFPIYVEKILSGDEELPRAWPVQGTTGYEFMNEVEDLFLEPKGYAAIEANYRGLRRNPELEFREVAREGKRRALTRSLWADVMRAARLANAWRDDVPVADFARAITETIVHLPVYRTYVDVPGMMSDEDAAFLRAAIAGARGESGVRRRAVNAIEEAFFDEPNAADVTREEFVARFQQTSGPATAKGVEDTALYVYVPLVSRNEVGGEPDRPLGNATQRLHERNASRFRDWPLTLIATNTHDTKRSADLRARLDVLTADPADWARNVTRWRRLTRRRKQTVRGRPAPDTNAEYLYYQSLIGLWPAARPGRRVDDLPEREFIERARDRLKTYMRKAAREAKTRTSWTDADPEYEKALERFVRETLEPREDAPFLGDLARITATTAQDGFAFSLARLVVHCCAPGVPDIYQGTELWTFTLVDPDNRRPVDFDARQRLLDEVTSGDVLQGCLAQPGTLGDDRVKLAVLSRLLAARRAHAELFEAGRYIPLRVPDGYFGFLRVRDNAAACAIIRTRVNRGGTDSDAGTVDMPAAMAGHWQSTLTDRGIDLVSRGGKMRVPVGDLIPRNHPCELLLLTSR